MTDTTLTHIEQLVDQLSREEQLRLLEYMAQRLHLTIQPKQPQNLCGIWRDRFPADFNLDAVLSGIREEWKREWPSEMKP
ncbi:MAG: hypothetical protein EXS64_11110 [Candidatus Latescibacteria bacterium]|nr:hypothetical protein [Candidatus Latescibacterota bacterium]